MVHRGTRGAREVDLILTTAIERFAYNRKTAQCQETNEN